MKKTHNFNAGPSILPEDTIKNTAQAILDFNGSGMSLLEISHRSKDFKAVVDEAVAMFKEQLEIPEGYSVLFLGGGASLQFCMAPYNLLKSKAAYVESGAWAQKAAKEAKFFGEVEIVASSADKNFSYYPKIDAAKISKDAEYLHITTNNTIFGTQIHADPDVALPMVADMSSDIFSRPIDIGKYVLIYGGVQKNLGPAGMAFAIVKDSALGKVGRKIPSMLDYSVHIKNESLYNTPPCMQIYAVLETLRWIKRQGGVKAIQKHNQAKAKELYDYLDSGSMFVGTAEKTSRSLMNVTFVMQDKYAKLEEDFLNFAKKQNMVGIKGHRSVGGFRASIYNALPLASVQALIACMREFESAHA